MSSMAFKVDDQAVHPRHGIVRIVKLEARTFGAGPERQYYRVEIPTGTVWVQVDDTASGLRRLISEGELVKYRKLLASAPMPLAADFRQRQTELAQRQKDASFRARCELVRDLSAVTWQKTLNDSFSSMLRRAYAAICAEWAVVAQLSIFEATDEVGSLLLEGRRAYEQVI
jgi:RNA polymerase-interacting CarD/CdnL/TRCF family regulator